RRWGRSASRRRSAPAGLPRRSVGAICTRSRRRLEQPHALYLIAFVELFTQHLLLLTGLGDGALPHRTVAADQLRQRGDGHGGAVVGRFELGQEVVDGLLVVGDQLALPPAVITIAERVERCPAPEAQLRQH